MTAITPRGAASRNRALLIRGAAGLVTGLATGYATGRLAKALGATRETTRWSDHLALMLAALLLAGAAYLWLLAVDRDRLGRALECDAGTPATSDEVALFRLQAVLLALTGLLFALPPLLGPMARSLPELGLWTMVVEGALVVAQGWLNLRAWRRADEFARQALLRAAAVAFVAGQAGLLAWSAAETLLAAPPLRAFDAVTVMTLIYIAASAMFTLAPRRA